MNININDKVEIQLELHETSTLIKELLCMTSHINTEGTVVGKLLESLIELDQAGKLSTEWSFTVQYSEERGEIYVLDLYGKQIFMIPDNQIDYEPSYMTQDELRKQVAEDYQSELQEMGFL